MFLFVSNILNFLQNRQPSIHAVKLMYYNLQAFLIREQKASLFTHTKTLTHAHTL